MRVNRYLTSNLLEKTALLSEKTQALNTNITIYYRSDFNDRSIFWGNYIERRNWKNAFTLKLWDWHYIGLLPNITNNEKDIIYNESLPTSFCK